jgi:hypothetical protein
MMWRRFWPLFFVGVLFSALVIFSVHAEETQNSTPSELSTTIESPQVKPNWDSFDQLLDQLESEAMLLSQESIQQLSVLRQSLTEAKELRVLLKHSELSVMALSTSLNQEREAADQALKAFQFRAEKAELHRDRWMVGTFILAGVSAILTGFLVATF